MLTPQPGPARAITEDALGKAVAADVLFVEGLRATGRTVTEDDPRVSGLPQCLANEGLSKAGLRRLAPFCLPFQLPSCVWIQAQGKVVPSHNVAQRSTVSPGDSAQNFRGSF